MNPIDLLGHQFLVLYVVLLAVNVKVAVALRSRAPRRGGSGSTMARELDPYGVAYLSTNGMRQVVLTAVDGLSHGRGLVVAGRMLRLGGAASAWHPVEHAVLEEVGRQGALRPFHLANLLERRPEMAQLVARLAAEGLLVTPPAARTAARTAALAYLPLIALGTARV